MRGIFIVVEGQTEEEFVKKIIHPYFISKNIYDVRAKILNTSPGHKGGDLKYSRFKHFITKLLKSQTDILVTSLIDFFKLKKDFPGFESALNISNHSDRVQFLEKSCSNDINENQFIPYFQLHEIEGLLFTKIDGFNEIPQVLNDKSVKQKLIDVIVKFPNPEEINDGETTAPSKRLQHIIPGYEKVSFAEIIASRNSIDSILEKCPRFKNWIDILLDRMK